MKHGIPSYHFGLRITAQFAGGYRHETMNLDPDGPERWWSGYGAHGATNGGACVQAIAEWLMPRADDWHAKPSLARCMSYNVETGELEADVYGEHAGRVLTVFRRLGVRELNVHGIQI